ncbi:ABC transporter substrate-binding protein [soil metagenome]|jgi:branched-chain amino acid transport system substrate-binding protein
MQRLTKVLLAALVVALSSLVLAACGDDDDEGGSGGGGGGESLDLTIGSLVPQTGGLAPFAPAGEKAIGLAVEEINTAIEEAGADHTITSLIEDTQTDPQAAVQAARKLTSEDATCFNGAWASGSTIPVAESVSTREEILQISPASTSPEITDLEDDDLLFRTAPADTFQGPLLADVIEDGLGGAEGLTVNIGARNDSYGTGLADEFSKAWEEKGGTVGETVVYDIKQPSYNSEAGQIVSGNPDGILIVDFPDPFNKVGPALVRTGDWDPETAFGPDGLAFPNLAELVGSDVVEGMRATAPGAPDEGPGSAFDTLFDDAGGATRAPFNAQNFDNVILCYLAAVAAGSTDGAEMAAALRDVTGAPGDEYTWEELPDAIEALQNGEDIDYQGVTGDIEFDEAGDPQTGVFDVFAFRGDELETTSEVEFGGSE